MTRSVPFDPDHECDSWSFSHYSKTPLSNVRRMEQPEWDEFNSFLKPRGLWISVDGPDDWPAWCESEEFSIGSIRYVVELSDSPKPLWLRSAGELDRFTRTYGRPGPIGYSIDWPRVAKDHPGLIIAPYQWTRRMEIKWYYGWDCASGCIWEPSAIRSVVAQPSHA